MRHDRERGFTLLELLVTLAVTTIGLVGLFALQRSVGRGNTSAGHAAEATQVGTAALEHLRSARATDMVRELTGNVASTPPIDVTSFSEPIAGSTGTVAGRAGMTYRRRVIVTSITGAMTALWKVRVEVGWTDDGATAGGSYDHTMGFEVIRTVEEAM